MSLGFIILRHVNNETTNNYWIECYESIRKHYPDNNIIIIDDNSNNYLTEKELHNTTIINSEYHGRGELLPYIYYLQFKLFEVALIIHDSVFLNTRYDFSADKYKIIWDFDKMHLESPDYERKMLETFNDKGLLDFYEGEWRGCFGGMCIITHDYLKEVNNKYNLENLLPFITSRQHRCCFERVIACLLQFNHKRETLLGDIMKYCQWGITFEDRHNYRHLPMTKVWTGR